MDPRFVVAMRYREAGLAAEAWSTVDELLQDTNPEPAVLMLAAMLRLEAGTPLEALPYAQRLVVADPGGAENHFWLGFVHHRRGDLDEAESAYRNAIQLRANYAEAWNDLGNVLADAGRPAEAIHAFRRAIGCNGGFAKAYNNLGAVLASQGFFAQSARAYEEAIARDADNLAARTNLGVAQLEQGNLATARATFEATLARLPSDRNALDNRLYARLYDEGDPGVIVAEHRAWGRTLPLAKPMAREKPDRALRVGYVSPDFRRHSVAFFIAPVLRAHDPTAVDVFCYSDVMRADDVTHAIQDIVPHWCDTYGWTDAALAERIRADGVDILVDLAGHTQGNRLALFARRAAPIQISGIGYAATTGVPAIDYRLCDAITDPPEAEAWSTEGLLRLTPGLHCYYPPAGSPDPSPLPAARNGFITFGSFNKLAKVSPVTVDLWAAVLRAFPDARLTLKSKPLAEEDTCAAVRARFAKAGIAPERMSLSGWLAGDSEHMAAYRDIDIALDTFPYNGTTTTCEALWMGVPVLTLLGQGHAARVSASLLAAVDLDDWVASTPDEFTALAQHHGGNLQTLAALRADLRPRVATSSLCDAKAHARGLEEAYLSLYREAGDGRGPSR
ncbi:MAG: O-linked N-acetylglucosamine transferase, SPINDLY family protein [Candidatus Binataceae bacterium]